MNTYSKRKLFEKLFSIRSQFKQDVKDKISSFDAEKVWNQEFNTEALNAGEWEDSLTPNTDRRKNKKFKDK